MIQQRRIEKFSIFNLVFFVFSMAIFKENHKTHKKEITIF